MLAACGVSAVSQTAGPETVLPARRGIPYALLGFVTDYANGVSAEPTPVDELMRLIARQQRALRRRRSRARSPRSTPPRSRRSGSAITWQ